MPELIAVVALFGVLALVLTVWLIWLTGRVGELEGQLARLTGQAAAARPATTVVPAPGAGPVALTGQNTSMDAGMAEVRGFLLLGQKIAAIKRYRELTGVGLKEAKDAVEAMHG